jgi:hypothetical protein
MGVADSLIKQFNKQLCSSAALPRKRFAIQELGHQDQPLIRPQSQLR